MMDHSHRYQWASSCVYGTVLDIACGIGYGSRYLVNNPRVTNYIGVDIAPEAIDKAKINYSSDVCSFYVGSAYDLTFIQDESIDVLVSMETIEHLQQPELAMKEFRRILKKDGIFLGSVPTRGLDEHHDQYHGGNQYHLTRFDFNCIKELLSKYFDFVNIYLSQIRLCIETHPLTKSIGSISPVQIESIKYTEDLKDLGIFLFAASLRDLDEPELSTILPSSSSVFLGPLYFEKYAKYIDLYNQYMLTTNLYQDQQKICHDLEDKYQKLYSDYLLTTNMYQDLQKIYNDMDEKYQKLYLDYQLHSNTLEG